MQLNEKASYLQGLIEGLDINAETKENKIILKMAEIISDLTNTVEILQTRVDDLTELCDDLDKDLGDVEEDLYCFDNSIDDIDDDWEDFDDDDVDGISDSIPSDMLYDDNDEDNELYEVECPTCHNTLTIDDATLDEGSMECPNCGEVLEFDFNDITIEDIENPKED